MNLQWQIIKEAFPSYLESEVEDVLSILDLNSRDFSSNCGSINPFAVIVDDLTLKIPYRIYYQESNLSQVKRLSPLQNEILYCFYTRHHDGYIREQCLKKIINSTNPWIAPYLVQLIGEYVIEILEVIYQRQNEISHELYREFLENNHDF
jgi:hypothetical protein